MINISKYILGPEKVRDARVRYLEKEEIVKLIEACTGLHEAHSDSCLEHRNEEKQTLAFLPDLGYNENDESYAGVAELVDALDSKSSEVCPS